MISQKEIIAALLGDETDGPMSRHAIAEWIEAEGITPPDGWVLVENNPRLLARKFHAFYEGYSSAVGYSTRDDTKIFDENSPNGRLMIATCAAILESPKPEVKP